MKGLYYRPAEGEAEGSFIIQETGLPGMLAVQQVRVKVKACGLGPVDLKLLGDVGIQRDVVPVGREVSGVVLQVGSKVSFFQPDDEVVGILPLDSPWSGLCDVIDIDEHHLVQKPEKLDWVCAAGALRDGVCAYTALHTHARMAAGHTLLVLDGASPMGLLCIQLACYHGVRVLATAHTPEEHTMLEQLRPSFGIQEALVARVIPVYGGASDLLSVCLEETGGLGLDIVIDSGVRLHEEEEPEERKLLPHKYDIISMLGEGGHWVTSQTDLQLDPPDSRLLYLKSVSLSFLNPDIWSCSSGQQGRYLHILKDVVEKLSTGILRPQPEEAVPLYGAAVAMAMVQRRQRRKAVVQL